MAVSVFGQRVLIFFMGREDERLILPVKQYNPSKVYIFIYNSDSYDKNFSKFFPICKKGIEDFNPKIEIIKKYVDFINYYKVCQEISKIIKFEKDNNSNVEITLNVSTGSKVSAVAMIDAARLWEVNSVYVYSNIYDPAPKEGDPHHTGEMIIIEPPVFPLHKPNWNLIESLRVLDKLIKRNFELDRYESDDTGYVMKSAIQKELFKNNIVSSKKTTNKDSNKNSREQMALKQKILAPLEKGGYIKLKKESRSKKVYLTKEGERVASIFRFYNPKK